MPSSCTTGAALELDFELELKLAFELELTLDFELALAIELTLAVVELELELLSVLLPLQPDIKSNDIHALIKTVFISNPRGYF